MIKSFRCKMIFPEEQKILARVSGCYRFLHFNKTLVKLLYIKQKAKSYAHPSEIINTECHPISQFINSSRSFFILSKFSKNSNLNSLGCETVQAFQTRNGFTQENGIVQDPDWCLLYKSKVLHQGIGQLIQTILSINQGQP